MYGGVSNCRPFIIKEIFKSSEARIPRAYFSCINVCPFAKFPNIICLTMPFDSWLSSAFIALSYSLNAFGVIVAERLVNLTFNLYRKFFSIFPYRQGLSKRAARGEDPDAHNRSKRTKYDSSCHHADIPGRRKSERTDVELFPGGVINGAGSSTRDPARTVKVTSPWDFIQNRHTRSRGIFNTRCSRLLGW